MMILNSLFLFCFEQFEVAMSMEQLTEDNSRLESFLENDLVSLLNRSLSPNDISFAELIDVYRTCLVLF